MLRLFLALAASTCDPLMLQIYSRFRKDLRKVGCPGFIGCLDCVGWDWDACPKALQGSVIGKDKTPTIRMEVICDMDLRIWHLCFGFPGSMNDLNISSVSPFFAEVLSGKFPNVKAQFEVAGESFNWL